MKKTINWISIIYIALIIAGITGEVKCIIKFCQCDFKPSYKAEIIYGLGVVTGFGAVIGYMDIKD